MIAIKAGALASGHYESIMMTAGIRHDLHDAGLARDGGLADVSR